MTATGVKETEQNQNGFQIANYGHLLNGNFSLDLSAYREWGGFGPFFCNSGS